VCGRDDFSGEMEPTTVSKLESENQQEMCAPFSEVLNTLGSENIVIPLPRELRLDEAL